MLTVGLAPLGRRRAAAVVKDGTILAVRSDAPVVSTAPGRRTCRAAEGRGSQPPVRDGRGRRRRRSVDGRRVRARAAALPSGCAPARRLSAGPSSSGCGPSHALARQAAAAADGSALLLVTRPQRSLHTHSTSDGTIRDLGPVAGTAALGKAMRRVATAVGVHVYRLAGRAERPGRLRPPGLRTARQSGVFAHVEPEGASSSMRQRSDSLSTPPDRSARRCSPTPHHPHRPCSKARRPLAQAGIAAVRRRRFAT